MFHFKQFQYDDLARSAMHDGAVLAWDKGGGKTIAAFAWPMLKARLAGMTGSFNLIVAPGSLHEQFIAEARNKFGIKLRRLDNQEAFHADPDIKARVLGKMNQSPITNDQKHRFWITSYTALGYNGADEWQPKEQDDGSYLVNSNIINVRKAWCEKMRRELRTPCHFKSDDLATGIGEEITIHDSPITNHQIKCLFIPTLATLCADIFDAVVVDEAVRMQASESYISTGVRKLRPRFRLVGTATPVKNYLDSMFWLAQWACGGTENPNARWPYENQDAAKQLFSREFMMLERNLSAEEREAKRTGRHRKIEKKIPRICNLHRLWKLLAPVVIRRRKQDMSEDIVPKTIIPIRTKLGTAQKAVYGWHLLNAPKLRKDGEPMSKLASAMTQLQMLRQAALCPDTDNLPVTAKHSRSWTDHNPKQAAILKLIEGALSRGEQMVVMSPFQHFSETLFQRLRQARVSVCLLDGRLDEKKRGKLAAAFKRREYSVLIGGIKSMGEGHSFSQCPNLILPSLEWAFDNNDQAIDRVHRLDSEKPVNIYVMVGEGTIDERLESLFREKGDCASLALDGRLFADDKRDLNLAELLDDAVRNFNAKADTIDETDIEAEWDSLCRKLSIAETRFREWHPPVIKAEGKRMKDEVREIREAVDALNFPAFGERNSPKHPAAPDEPFTMPADIAALLAKQAMNPHRKK